MLNYLYPPYLFVIDTSGYAGNFERELCAYVTGIVGDCEVGSAMKVLFENKHKHKNPKFDFEENVLSLPDDHGCYRPCSIYLTKRMKNKDYYNSVAIFLEKQPTREEIDFMKNRAVDFQKTIKCIYNNKPHFKKILGFRLIKHTINTEVEEI